MTAAEAVRELFARLPLPGKDLVWLTDELLSIAQHTGSISLGVERADADSRTLVWRLGSNSSIALPGRGPLSLFRPLLARIAMVGSDETGTERNPYGDRFTLTRSSRSGPVRLEIEFTNTPASQELVIARTPVAVAPRPSSVTTESPADPQPQPSA